MLYKIILTNGSQSDILHNYSDNAPKITDGTIVESVNAVPSFSFTVYPNNPLYNDIVSYLSTIRVIDMDTDAELFCGRVITVSQYMTADGRIYKIVSCEGELGYLCDTVQDIGSVPSGTHTTSLISNIIYEHNSNNDNKFEVGSVELGGFPEGVDSDWQTTFDLLKYLYVDSMGGEIRMRKDDAGARLIDYAKRFEEPSDTIIAVSDNLQSLSVAYNNVGLITRLYPLGGVMDNGKRLTVAASGKTQGSPYIDNAKLIAKYGIICGTVIYDDIRGDASNITSLALRLWRRGMSYMDNLTVGEAQYSISALDLSVIDGSYDRLKLYGVYSLHNSLMNIFDSVRITGRTLYLDRPYLSKITIGSKQTALSELLARR